MKPGGSTPNQPESSPTRAFWDETAKGIANVIANVSDTWYGEKKIYYSRERENLEKYITPFKYGIGATVFLFINFRITGSRRFQTWRQEWWRKKHRKPTTWNKSNDAKIRQQPPVGFLESKRETEVKEALASMKIFTDFLVSLSVGTSGVLFLLESEKNTMRQDFEQAPLVCGRSVVAEQMCSGMESVANQYHEQLQDSGDDTSLGTFAKFISNCRLRADFEEKERSRLGIRIDKPVVVPYPGLLAQQKDQR